MLKSLIRATPSTNRAPLSATLSGVTTLTVTHNLGYYPDIWILDTSTSQVIDGVVTHNSINEFKIDFAVAITGAVYYR